jgi:hypothetical protein
MRRALLHARIAAIFFTPLMLFFSRARSARAARSGAPPIAIFRFERYFDFTFHFIAAIAAHAELMPPRFSSSLFFISPFSWLYAACLMLPLIHLLLPILRRLLVIFRCFSPMPPLRYAIVAGFFGFRRRSLLPPRY